MIEAIRTIGKQLLSHEEGNKRSFLKHLTPVLPVNEREKSLVCILDFNTKESKVYLDFKELEEDDHLKYLWVGNTPDRTNKYITTDKFSNIFSETLPNFVKWAKENSIEKFNKLEYFWDTTENGKLKFLKPELFSFGDVLDEKEEDILKLKKKLKTSRTKAEYSKSVKEAEKLLLGKEGKNIKLFVVKLDGNLICDTEEYVSLLYHEKIGILFDDKGKFRNRLGNNRVCYLCNEKKKRISSESARFKLKFFITDKDGFSSNLDKKFTKNYGICEMCYKHIMAGEMAVLNNFKTKIANINTFIMPEFVYPLSFDPARISEYLKNITDIVYQMTEVEDEMRATIEELGEVEKNSFLINYLFSNPDSKGRYNNVLKLIKDVPPSRIEEIHEAQNRLLALIKERHGRPIYMVDLRKLYYLFPIKVDRTRTPKSLRFLEIIDSIFTVRKINYSSLIGDFMETIRIIRFSREGYNISTSSNIENVLISMNYALKFFEDINILKHTGGEKISENSQSSNIKKEILDFWSNSEVYKNEQRQAAFLLGTLIGAVGNAQFLEGHETKPILNKINFQGIGKRNLLRLASEVFEKLKEYKRLSIYTERIFFEFTKRVNSKEKWELTNEETVFYVLSGYAFETVSAIEGGISKKEADKEKQIMERNGVFIQ